MMKAPKDAVSLATENPKLVNGLTENFCCVDCDYVGQGFELLCVENSKILWCPKCGSDDWLWL